MKIEDAIQTLKDIYPSQKQIVTGEYPHVAEGIDLAIEALEKQIPKKPIIEKWSPALCSSCGSELSESLGDGYYKHWKNKKVCDCGQLLNW